MGYVGLGIIYLVLLVVLGVRSLKHGHWVMFVIGFLVPLFWIIGGLLPPKGRSRIDAMYEHRERSG